MSSKDIPLKVLNAFKHFEEPLGNIKYLGEINDTKYYLYAFPEEMDVGFPQIVSFKDNKVTYIEDFEALKIVNLLIKN